MKRNLDRKILLTGANGYISRHILSYLSKSGVHVTGLVRKGSDISHLSEYEDHLLFYESTKDKILELASTNFDVVIHTVGTHDKENNLSSYHHNMASNVFFGVQVLESLGEKPKTIVYTNSYSSFIHRDINLPDGMYGASKKAFSAFLQHYHRTYGISVVNCHLYDTYGPYDKRKKILDIYIDAALTQTPIKTSMGNRAMNFIYIDDLAKAIGDCALLSDKTSSAHFHNTCIYGEETLSLAKVRSLVEEVTGKKIIIQELLPDNAASLEFAPLYPLLPTMKYATSLRDGIKNMVNARK